jgi:CheY-like chemotaxis protein
MYRNFRILVAEDDENDAYFLKRAFLRAGINAPIEFVENGEKAIAYLARPREEEALPKLMLMDLKMPGMGGFEVLKWLRGQEWVGQLPVVILSSSGYQPDIDLAHELGANGYVVKPVGLENMLEVVRDIEAFWLRRHCCPSCRPHNEGSS